MISFMGLLTLLFIGLKLTNYIDWSWLWVLAPIWGQLLLIAIFWAVVFTFDLHPTNGKTK
jgi:hypothetical protein